MSENANLRYQLLVHNIVDYAISMLTADGIITTWNKGAQQANGYLPEEIIGKHFSYLYTDEDRAKGLPQQALDNASQYNRYETSGWWQCKNGTRYQGHLLLTTLYSPAGELLGFATIIHNAPPQVTQNITPDDDKNYRLLVNGIADYAIYLLDANGQVASWNTGAQRTLGYSSAEIIGQHYDCFYRDIDRDEQMPQRDLDIARQQGRMEDYGWRQRSDGSTFWSHVVIDSIYQSPGVVLGFAIVTRDVTEKYHHEQQLLKSKKQAEINNQQMAALTEFLDTVIANIPSAVIVKDANSGRILLVNPQAESLLQQPSTKLLGNVADECLDPIFNDFLQRMASEAIRNGGINISEQQLLLANDSRILHARTSIIDDADKRTSYQLVITNDVTEQRVADARIQHMTHHDTLTSLPNRELFRGKLQEALLSVTADCPLTATLYLDLDNFKNVNDALGHQMGDKLLQVIARRLQTILDDKATLARVGGDEFAVVIPQQQNSEQVDFIARRLIEAVRPAVTIDGQHLSVGLSVGIAIADSDQFTPDYLLRCADIALHQAKRNGRNRFEYFCREMDTVIRKRREIELELRQAINTHQLELYYQPIISQSGQKVTGYEALVRWNHPKLGMVMPGDFIPIAEETGLIHNLGEFALHEACREAATWQAGETVSVNLSPIQFKNHDLYNQVVAALRESGLPPHRLEVEITESVLLDDTQSNINVLEQIKSLGVRIALDDFGTGYSSLSYLRAFHFDKIKIDKSFVKDMQNSRESLAIIRAITGIGRSLGMETTAEGVENDEQFHCLQSEGCSLFQGYYFGRPLPASQRLTQLPEEFACTMTVKNSA